MRLGLRVSAAVGGLALLFHVLHGQLGLGGHGLDYFTSNELYDGVILGGAVSCLARAWLVKDTRLPWLVIGIGLLLDGTGEVYYTLAWGDSGNPPIPSLADLFYLLYYPAAYVGIVLLVRRRAERFSASTWLDGAIAATTSAAIVSALVFEPIVRSATHGDAAAIATNLAYPIGDLILLAIVAGVFGLAGWRPGRAWLLLGLGLGMSAIADTAYVYENAQGTYAVGGILDSLWIGSALMTGCAAWQPVPRTSALQLEGRRMLVIPGVLAVASLAVLVYGGFDHVGAVALVLASFAVLLVIVRAGWTFHENLRLLERSHHDAVTDALTGLGNRRIMTADLERAFAHGPDSPDAALVMFDLDGFKLYNDAYGHLAGDTLLAHLGHRLQAAVAAVGTAYRLGGDEFCVLMRSDLDHADVHIAAAVAALSAEGEGFRVGASYGTVLLPREVQSATQALRVADDRMYAQKGGRRGSAREQTHDVLLGLLRERQPDLHDHLCNVGRLAELVARSLGVGKDELQDVRQAAELHDIGKAAIPESILSKPGPLNDEEWAFMRRHTIVGERILAAAPALAGVAPLVRASHERWDGTGYPDRLAGEAIPLGARIVSVCDAFDAMTSTRPYSRAMTPADAIAELLRVAGSQFDPVVVREFAQAWAREADAAEQPTGTAGAAPL